MARTWKIDAAGVWHIIDTDTETLTRLPSGEWAPSLSGETNAQRGPGGMFGGWDAGASPPDTTPPGVPSGMGAVAGDTEIVLDWDTNAEADVASYKLYRGTSAGVYDTDVTITGAANSTYTNTGLTNGTEYFYAVTCTDDTGNESDKSTEVSATPVAAPVAGFTHSLFSDGSAEYVMIADVGNDLDLQLGDTASWCFWMKPDGYVTYDKLFASRTSAGDDNGWEISQHTNGRSRIVFDSGASYQCWAGLTNLETSGGWHHVCWTWDGTQPSDSDLGSAGHLKVYIDGVAEIPTHASNDGDIGAIDYSGITPRIFAKDQDKYGLDGWMCDLRMYGVVLSEEEVEAIYNDGDGEPGTAGLGSEPVPDSITRFDDLIGWWKMEEGSGETLIDASGNQKTGIIYQCDWTTDTPDD